MKDTLRSQRRAVSRASVYRVLEELERVQLVQRVETGQAMVRYERVCGDSEEHHHHLVCDSCGVVMPFSDAALERAIAKVSERVPLAVVSEHEIVLHGACHRCAASGSHRDAPAGAPRGSRAGRSRRRRRRRRGPARSPR